MTLSRHVRELLSIGLFDIMRKMLMNGVPLKIAPPTFMLNAFF